MDNKNPIGVFDSGVGGLTVYKALRHALPHEDFIYLGDTARLPYGTKSADTVTQYALQAAQLLMEEKIKLLVVACNTASALALPSLQMLLPDLPMLGVIKPGAEAAAKTSRSGKIAVLGTEGTVRSRAYETAIRKLRPDAQIETLACNLLVSLAEEGWCEGAEAEIIIRRYLDQLIGGFDTLVLGCTHFPLLTPVLKKLLPLSVKLVDSAATTAEAVATFLDQSGLQNKPGHAGKNYLQVTDSPERFARLAKRFLDTVDIPDIRLVDSSLGSKV